MVAWLTDCAVWLQIPAAQVGRHMCPHCGKLLSSDSNLRIHINGHLGIYKYVCRICGKGYLQNLHLKGHMAAAHNIEAMKSSCPVCNKSFTRLDNMKKHMREIHHVSSQPQPHTAQDPVLTTTGGGESSC